MQLIRKPRKNDSGDTQEESYMETQTGILTVVSGFSGAGKGTIMKRLLEKYPDHYALSISATTRALL